MSVEPAGPEKRPLTAAEAGEALMRLFLENAEQGRNAANDELVAALLQRARELRARADLPDEESDDGPALGV